MSHGSTESRKRVVIIGAGIGGHTCSRELAKLDRNSRALDIFVITQNDFVEWQVASSYFICHAQKEYPRFAMRLPNVAHTPDALPTADPSKQVFHLVGNVTEVSDHAHTVSYCDRDGETRIVKYDYLVIASGFSLPIFQPEPFETVQNRYEALVTLEDGIRSAKEITVIGAGPVAIEMIGDIREIAPRDCELTLAVSFEDLLAGWSPITRQRVENKLNELGIRVMKNCGRCSSRIQKIRQCFEARLKFDDVGWLAPIAIPAYSREPATNFLAKGLLTVDNRVEVDQYLLVEHTSANESNDAEEAAQGSDFRASTGLVFAMGSVTTRCRGWIGEVRLKPQATHIARNIYLHVQRKLMQKYVDPMQDRMTEPPILVVGHDTWAHLNVQVLPWALQCFCFYCGFPVSCLVCPMKPCICGYFGSSGVSGPDLAKAFVKRWLYYGSSQVYQGIGSKGAIADLNLAIMPTQIIMRSSAESDLSSVVPRSINSGPSSMNFRSVFSSLGRGSGARTPKSGTGRTNLFAGSIGRSSQSDSEGRTTLSEKERESTLLRTPQSGSAQRNILAGMKPGSPSDLSSGALPPKASRDILMPGQTASAKSF